MIKIILVLIAIWLLFPIISRYVGPYIKRWLMRQAIKQFTRRAGFDSDAGRNRKKKENSRQSRKRQTPPRHSSSEDPIIPREYAEDVEFTEIHTYSEETVIGSTANGTRKGKEVEEEQVSDAEIIEVIKNK